MRLNSFKKGQKVKRIQIDGSLSNTVMIVVATSGHACWVRTDHGIPDWTPSFCTYGANELESVR